MKFNLYNAGVDLISYAAAIAVSLAFGTVFNMELCYGIAIIGILLIILDKIIKK